MSVTIEIKLCTECPKHIWKSNPDPNDWFRDDECDLLCAFNKKPRIVSSSLSIFEQKNPNYTSIPKWCPLKKETKSKKEKLKETIII